MTKEDQYEHLIALAYSLAAAPLKKGLDAACRSLIDAFKGKDEQEVQVATLPASYIGPVGARIRNLKKPTKCLITWGETHTVIDLEPKEDQIVVFEKRHHDLAPLVVAVMSSCSISITMDVVDANSPRASWHNAK